MVYFINIGTYEFKRKNLSYDFHVFTVKIGKFFCNMVFFYDFWLFFYKAGSGRLKWNGSGSTTLTMDTELTSKKDQHVCKSYVLTAMSVRKYFACTFSNELYSWTEPKRSQSETNCLFFLPAECKQIRAFSPVCVQGFGSIFFILKIRIRIPIRRIIAF